MVEFRPFEASEFDEYKDKSTKEYAQDLIRSKKSKKRKALRDAINEFDSILPQGIATPYHFLNHVTDEQGEAVGFLWFGINGKDIFVYDFWINENQRRKGFGKQSLEKLEQIAVAQEMDTITLHVFDHNVVAHGLYESVRYKVLSTEPGGSHMQKRISGI